MSPSSLKKFNEKVYVRRDDLLYVDKDENEKDLPELGFVKGKVGWTPFHQWQSQEQFNESKNRSIF